MNNQEAFNKMVRHLRSQKERSIAKDGVCLYRGSNGLKCAVGALIPDNEYTPEFEEVNAANVATKCPSLYGINHSLLHDMQYLHDNTDVKEWENGFKDIAEDFDLYVPQQ